MIVFGISVAGVGVWRLCTGTGFHYRAVTAGLIAIFGMSLLCHLGMFFGGLRGTASHFLSVDTPPITCKRLKSVDEADENDA